LDPIDIAFAGAARQAELLRAGELTARELVELHLARIARIDPELNAFRVVLAERALADADQADARLRAGDERPLLGVPVAIKDNADVAGEATLHGTNATAGTPAGSDSEVVRRLRAAGAVVIGKTHMPELAIWPFTETATFGATRNPWNRDRTPGGSSGGSAAAVAAGLAPLALASDGAGSIRIPAASCGLFGLKPQRGRVSLAPDPEHWHGLSVFGPHSRTVLDGALFLDAVAGAAPRDADTPPPPERPFAEAATTSPGRLKIAVGYRAAPPTRVAPAHEEAVRQTAELLRSLGHEVREREVNWGNAALALIPRYLRGIHDDAARMPHPERLERRTRGVARLGRLTTPALVARARRDEASHAARLASALEDHDVMLMPVVAQPPVEIGRYEGRGALQTLQGVALGFGGPFTAAWNVTGQPAASVPAGEGPDGLPLSVQLVGRPNDEATLISLAAQLEAERPWAARRPPVG